MKNIENKINEFMELIEKEIQDSFPQNQPENLYEPIKYLMFVKGKRIRPILTLVAAGLVGGNTLDALKPAVAFELLHNFTLIHDDIMDKSPTRRGRDTIHTKWNEAIAILSGDLLLALAYRKIVESVNKEINQKILKTYTDSFVEVCEGQGFDMDFEIKSDICEEEYFNMIDKKTAKLLEKALIAGAQIGNGTSEQINTLSEIGKNLGLAFQLQDDLLDLTATSEKFGKEIGKDIREGKKTLIIIKAKELFNEEKDILLLNKFYQNNGLEGEDVKELIFALEKNKIFEQIKTRINLYFGEIEMLLTKLPENEYKQMLEFIIDFTLKRDF